MKSFEIESWTSVNRLTPGRRAYVARRIKDVALASEMKDVARLCDSVIVQEQTQLELLRRYGAEQAQATSATWSPEILALDVALDRLLAQLRDTLAVLAMRPGSARGDAAKGLLERYFAQGVAYYTQQVIEEEVERVRELLVGLAADQAQVAGATVDDIVAEIVPLHGTYAEAVASFQRVARTNYQSVKDGDLANQRALLELVVQILAQTAALPPTERLARREALLAPVAAQDAEISALVRARRRIRDVDPETGAPEPTGDAPAPPDAAPPE